MSLKMIRASNFLLLASLAVVICYGLQIWIHKQSADGHRFEPVVQSHGDNEPASQKCAECHQAASKNISASPHGNTLSAGHEPWIRERFAGQSFSLPTGGATVYFKDRDQQLWMESDASPEAIRVDWMFGSGRHAMTPVSLMVNSDFATELIEGSVSWYSPGVLGLTPGAEVSGTRGMSCLGSHQDHRTTLECFGCHVTRLQVDRGRIRTDTIVPGVTCDRCHFGGAQHTRAAEQGRPNSMQRWAELSPLESVNRCGECHRRADQLTKEELSPERTVLVRFASVGLAMSRCFMQQNEIHQPNRLDCLTCHDPHRPAEKSAEFYVSKCLACHGASESQAGECTSIQTGDNCRNCHMPSVRVTDKLVLTDHWIRVRKNSDPPAVDQKSQ